MKYMTLVLAAVLAFTPKIMPVAADVSPIEGRWDLTIHYGDHDAPSWLEVIHSGFKTLVGRFVGTGGCSRPVSKVNFADGKMSFSIPPQWEREDRDMTMEGTLQGDSLVGTLTGSNGQRVGWSGHRAPALNRSKAPVWGKAITLFDGKTLSGWHTLGTAANQWIVENGMLRSPHSGANIATDRMFTDFKLHIEFRYPKGSNSGVYLRGRYEVQIEDDAEPEPPNNVIGSIYGFLPPSEPASKGAGEWQTFDAMLVGRMLTLRFNGVTTICNREIPGITGGALNSREGEPGPIYLQGDHGPIDFRNITITPAE